MSTPNSGTIDIPGIGAVDWSADETVDEDGTVRSRTLREARRADGGYLNRSELEQVKRQLDAG